MEILQSGKERRDHGTSGSPAREMLRLWNERMMLQSVYRYRGVELDLEEGGNLEICVVVGEGMCPVCSSWWAGTGGRMIWGSSRLAYVDATYNFVTKR